MSDFVNDIDRRVSRRIRMERERREWSLAQLAQSSGVSKAMISKVERCEASPTAALLGKLSGALGITMAALFAEAEGDRAKISRKGAQAQWQDPESGFRRTAISPTGAERLQLVQGELPPGARVAYPASSYGFFTQQMWVLDGELTFHEGNVTHVLAQGDCLELSEPADCMFENRSRSKQCRYLVALSLR